MSKLVGSHIQFIFLGPRTIFEGPIRDFENIAIAGSDIYCKRTVIAGPQARSQNVAEQELRDFGHVELVRRG